GAKIANPRPPRVDTVAAALTRRLDDAARLAAESDWRELSERLRQAEDAASQAAQTLQRDIRAADALVERRAELRGRFAAYTRKAARIGAVEDSDVAAALEETRELLSLAPCDLPAATSALRRFQQAISARQEATAR
ncbi:MAG TPA: hypothetical protein VE172_03545, partial [Stackebrandtia sp.]